MATHPLPVGGRDSGNIIIIINTIVYFMLRLRLGQYGCTSQSLARAGANDLF